VFDMPWEFARDPTRGTVLATEDALFVRNIFTTTPVDRLPPKTGALRLLIATSEPTGLPPLSARQEADDIRNGLSHLVDKGLFQIEVRENVTAERLHQEAATGRYDIVHFIGHGFWDGKSGKSGLVLEDGQQGQLLLGDRSLREILSGRKIRVVFLNACDTGRSVTSGSRLSTIAGTAQDLFGRGVPNVVANQLKVGDKAAATFAKAFYGYLAHGLTIAQATREARIACSYRPGMQSIDWAVPVVYARDADDALVEGRAQ
jgi:CHAT domain-containing protein